jgi:hypothetical protein
LAKPKDGHVRKPRPTLALVDAELLQPAEEPLGEPAGPIPLVAQHDHADASRLAVADGLEHRRLALRRCRAQGGGEARELRRVGAAEEGEGDVQVLAWYDSRSRWSAQLLVLSGGQARERLVRQEQGDEET